MFDNLEGLSGITGITISQLKEIRGYLLLVPPLNTYIAYNSVIGVVLSTELEAKHLAEVINDMGLDTIFAFVGKNRFYIAHPEWIKTHPTFNGFLYPKGLKAYPK